MEAFSRIGTKSGKNKTYGLKWKSPKNVGTKSGFSPKKRGKLLIWSLFYTPYFNLISNLSIVSI